MGLAQGQKIFRLKKARRKCLPHQAANHCRSTGKTNDGHPRTDDYQIGKEGSKKRPEGKKNWHRSWSVETLLGIENRHKDEGRWTIRHLAKGMH